MAGITAIVNALSVYMNAKMSAAGMPLLTDGGIAFGGAKRNETSLAPRIIMIPTTSRYGGPSPSHNASAISLQNPDSPGAGVRAYGPTSMGLGYVQASTTVTISVPDVAGGTRATATAVVRNGAIVSIVPSLPGTGYLKVPTVTIGGVGSGAVYTATMRPTPQALSVLTARAIKTEYQRFEVGFWGVNSVGATLVSDYNLDFDAAQQLVHIFIAACQAIAPNICTFSGGLWIDSTDGSIQFDQLGHYFVVTVEIATPVLSEPVPATAAPAVGYANPNVAPNPSFTIVPFGGGTPEAP